MRVRRLDVAIGIAAACAGAWSASLQSDGPWAILGGAFLGASLGVLRGAPLAGLGLAVAGTTLCGVRGPIPDGPMLLLLIGSFGIGLYAGRVAGIVAVVALFFADLTHALTADDWVPTVMFPAVFWGAGRALRGHEVVAARLRERNTELAEEREAYAQLSVRYERARIAAELHDIVAHAISVMVVQASAGQRLAAVDPGLTAQTFRTIADAARQAEDDMGRLVALLGDELDAGPAPDLALVQELVARAAGSGLDVTLRLEGPLDDIPGPTAATAYRVVQESLTNALRYAAGAQVAVRVRGGEDALDVEVANGAAKARAELAGAGTGNGLAGLRERIDAVGGSLRAGPLPEGGWLVAARIPRRALGVPEAARRPDGTEGRKRPPQAGPRAFSKA
jgi:signal transduction histidine kinase